MFSNKIVFPLIIVCLCSITIHSEENEFQKWTKNGQEYNNWTKQGQEFNKWTAGEHGSNGDRYTEAYNKGYEEAYREDRGMYAIKPLPKMAPIPKTGMSSQQDAFNRGFYEYYQELKERSLK